MTIMRRALAAGVASAALTWTTGAAAQAPPEEPQVTAPADDGLVDTSAEASAPAPEPVEPLAPPTSPVTVSDTIAAGRILFEVRGRYEFVDQKRTGVLTEKGESATVRTHLGWETGDWHGLRGLVEFEDVRQVGPEHFQVQVPGATSAPLNGAAKTRYPIINDPDVTELNRLQLSWTPNAAVSATLGRQRILVDDQRFIGNVGWRQDEQTFDAVRLDLTHGRFKLFYAYVSHVNRILGELRDWDSDSHLAQLTWSPAEQFRLQGFVYALDFANSAANSSITEGIKASGKTWVGLYQLAYSATYAHQGDYGGNTPGYGLDYWAADLAGTFDIYTAKVSYESLEGDGTRGFTTPLATVHAFQGWSDAFVQPLGGNKGFVDGLRDLNFTLNVKPRWKWTYLSNVDVLVRYHDFDSERTGVDLGREWNVQVQATLNPKLTAAIKYADFERKPRVPAGTATPPPSRTKVWFTLEYKL